MSSSLIKKRALVLGEDTRSFLSVIRSLGEAGMVVDVVTLINTTPSIYSKWINQVFKLNYQAFSQEQWSQEVNTILAREQYDLVIPCDERSLYPLLEIKEQNLFPTHFAIPEREQLGPLFDKEETKKLAKKLGIPVAEGDVVDLNEVQSNELISHYGMPLVLKPAMSYDSAQLNQRNSVVIAKQTSDIFEFAKHHQTCLVEQYFSGVGMGVSVLSVKGKIRAAFAHRRVSEPERGGGSSYRKSAHLDPSMLDACQKICSHLAYTGVAMFEFKVNDDNATWILIEINARFWGSLPLAIFAGVNFPALLATYLLTHNKPCKLTYNTNAYSRSLTSDLYDMKEEFDSIRYNGKTSYALKALARRVLGFSRLLTGNDKIDSFQWNDKAPFYTEIQQLFGGKIKNLFILNKATHLRKRALDSLPSSPITEILVICYGNIMRSPFAAQLIKEFLHGTKFDIQVKGAGFHPTQFRPSPDRCVDMAKNWNIDLSQHRSSWLSQAMIKPESQLIVYFDLKHEYLLNCYYQNFNAVNLAHFIPNGAQEEIADPYDGGEATLKQCYTNISGATNNLMKALVNAEVLS